MCGVVLSQVGIRIGVAKIVDRNDLNVMLLPALVMGTKNVAANSAVAINSNLNCHAQTLPSVISVKKCSDRRDQLIRGDSKMLKQCCCRR